MGEAETTWNFIETTQQHETTEIEECKNVIRDADQVLSYDTTFCLGEFYVSPLLFHHTEFIEKPVMPVLFLVHETKCQFSH